MDRIDREAREKSLAVQISETGAMIIPIVDGRPLSRAEFATLDESRRAAIESDREKMLAKVEEALSHLKDSEKSMNEEIKELEKQGGEFAISHHFKTLSEKYGEYEAVIDFLNSAKEFTLSNLQIFTQTA